METEKALIAVGQKGLQLRTLDDAYRFCQYLIKSGIAPPSYQTPEQALIAIQSGWELGMPPMRSLQSFCVVNRQPRLFGDAPLALVRQSGLLEYIKEEIKGDGETMVAICETKRKGDPEAKRTEFSVADAVKARLWGKGGTWQQYPQRMLQYRARSFNLRDNFPDCFGGATIAEEYVGVEMTDPAQIDEPKSAVLLEGAKPEPEPIAELPEAPPEPEAPKPPKKERKKKSQDPTEWLCENCAAKFSVPSSNGEDDICPECLSTAINRI